MTTLSPIKASRSRTPSGQPNPIDIHVGNRIRLRRTLLGISQEKLASLLGLTFQQIQKYEKGVNRVGASRLWDISKILETSISFFYEDINNTIEQEHSSIEGKPLFLKEDGVEFTSDPMQREETIELVKAYYKIPNRNAAKQLFDLIVTLSKTSYTNNDKEKQND